MFKILKYALFYEHLSKTIDCGKLLRVHFFERVSPLFNRAWDEAAFSVDVSKLHLVYLPKSAFANDLARGKAFPGEG